MDQERSIIDLVERGDMESVKSILSSRKVYLNQVKSRPGVTKEITPLIAACVGGKLDMIEILLTAGAQVDLAAGGLSALSVAVEAGRLDMVNLLIKYGAQVDLTMGERSPLTSSFRGGDVKMVRALLGRVHVKTIREFTSCKGIASPVKKWEFFYRMSPLNLAAKHGHVELVKWLLKQGVEVPFGCLFFAIMTRKSDTVEQLLNRGAEVNATGDGGWSALMLASYYGHTRIVEMLLERGAKVNLQNEEKDFALLLAAGKMHANVVMQLLKRGAHVNLRGGKNATAALQKAIVASAGYHDSVKEQFGTVTALLKWGADVNLPDDSGYTAFSTAVRIRIVKPLLDKGGLIETVSWDTLRHLAILGTKPIEVFQLLLEAGFEINQQDESGKTLLMYTDHKISSNFSFQRELMSTCRIIMVAMLYSLRLVKRNMKLQNYC